MRCLYCMEKYDEDLDVICPFCGNDVVNVENDSNCLPAGTVLKKRYILGRVLGDGGFGITYIGYDKALKRKVAVKEFFPNECVTRQKGEKTVTPLSGERGTRYENGLKSFQEEAQRLANLGSVEGVVNVFDVFADNGTAYIVMEYLSGETVAQIVEENRRLGFGKTMNIIVPVLRSLIKIHRAGVIHRDVSPQNIIRTEDGKIVLIDFGAARQNTLSMSKSVSIILKQGYAPIEQYDNKIKQGTWTDVYAAAATMYYMLTGVTPEYANSRLLDDTLVPISEMREGLPPQLDDILSDALAIRPEDRIQTAQELLDRIMTLKDFGRDPTKKKQKRIDQQTTQDVPKKQWKSYVGGTPYEITPAQAVRTDYEPKVITFDRSIQPITESPAVSSQPQPKRKSAAPLVAAFLIVILVLGAVLALMYVENIGKNITIPDFIGQNIGELNFDDYDFNIETETEYTFDPTKELGEIVDQDPKPSTKIKSDDGSVLIKLNVNSDEAVIMVPVLSNFDEKKAVATLEKWTFQAEVVKETNENVAEGTVIRTEPASGERIKGKSKVIVYIAEHQVEVPDLLGLNLEEAKTKLGEAGLKIGEISYKYSEDYENGLIMEQGTESGTKTDRDTPVSIVISQGEPPLVDIDMNVDLSEFQDYAPFMITVIADGNQEISQNITTEFLSRNGFVYKFTLTRKATVTDCTVEVKIDDQLYQTYALDFENGSYELTETYEVKMTVREPDTSSEKPEKHSDKESSSESAPSSEEAVSEPSDEKPESEPTTHELESDKEE